MSHIARILTKFRGSSSLKNAAWMILEKVISGFGLLFVTSYVAKYIGPSLFGKLTLAVAVFQIVQIAAQLGSDSVVFKRVARNRDSGIRLIRETAKVRVGIYVALSAPILAWLSYQEDLVTVVFLGAACVASLFSAWDVYVVYNNALLRAKLNAVVNLVGVAVGLGARYLIAKLGLDPMLLALPMIATTLVPLIIRLHVFKKEAIAVSPSLRPRRYKGYLLRAGGAVVLASVSVAIYTRIAQFVIADLRGEHDVGVYAAGLTIAASWSFVTTSLINSFYPAIYAAKSENDAERKAALLGRYTVSVGLFVTAGFSLFGKIAMSILYGQEYAASYWPGLVLCLATTVSALGTISYRYIIRSSGYSYLSKKMVVVLIISPFIYYPLVAAFGMMGAAFGVLIVEVLSLTVLNYMFKQGLVARLHRRMVFL